MEKFQYQIITGEDNKHIQLIAEWYLSEWNIPIQNTIEKIKALSPSNNEFQLLMLLNDKPIATGGIYTQVGLLERMPRLKIYKNWLALVYTKSDIRGKGFGALICNQIQEHAKAIGLNEIYLFTHTAENLYKRLDWQQLERIVLGDKEIVVMKKELK